MRTNPRLNLRAAIANDENIMICEQFIGWVKAHVGYARSTAEVDDGFQRRIASSVDPLYGKGNQS
jgi:hypothetical protein